MRAQFPKPKCSRDFGSASGPPKAQQSYTRTSCARAPRFAPIGPYAVQRGILFASHDSIRSLKSRRAPSWSVSVDGGDWSVEVFIFHSPTPQTQVRRQWLRRCASHWHMASANSPMQQSNSQHQRRWPRWHQEHHEGVHGWSQDVGHHQTSSSAALLLPSSRRRERRAAATRNLGPGGPLTLNLIPQFSAQCNRPIDSATDDILILGSDDFVARGARLFGIGIGVASRPARKGI